MNFFLRSFLAGLLVSCGLAVVCLAQSPSAPAEFSKASLELHIGGAFVDATGDLNGIFKNAPLVGGSLAYRPLRNFQVEGGLDAVFGAARVNGAGQLSGGGTLKTTDREYFLLLGGRLVLPFKQEKFLWSAGVGGAVASYNEVPVSVPGVRIICNGCGSRQGGGYYILNSFTTKINPNFGIGVTAKAILVNTEGDRLDTSLPFKSRDKWATVALTFSFYR
ncbi:MAG: hypothetical protein HOP19_03405 [Acidobacteria bacterium]|nr:hypothetical protein [Acidobacteriota bacterium]